MSQDYSKVYLDAMKTLKSFYNYQLKEDYVEAAIAAAEVAKLASQLKVISMQKVDIYD
jgi:hypothetical protein